MIHQVKNIRICFNRNAILIFIFLFLTPITMSYGADNGSVYLSNIAFADTLIEAPTIIKVNEPTTVKVKFKFKSPNEVGVIEVKMYSSNFNIVSINPERQFVEANKTSEWQWQVNSQETGEYPFYVSISKLEGTTGSGKEALRTLQTFERIIAVEATATSLLNNHIEFLFAVVGIILALFTKFFASRKTDEQFKKSKEEIAQAESKVEAQPQKVKPAWDLARVTLEAYFSRNLSQISSIFWLSVTVMLVGFCIIVWGITQTSKATTFTPGVIAALAGVITEFIGATFLFIYRSTIQQAINYTKTLERINSVGMAMQILDTMPDETNSNDLKSQTKATLVRLLVEQTSPMDFQKKQENKKSNKKVTPEE